MDLNQKRLGMMKDEHKSLPINRVVALRFKSYVLEVEGKVDENNIVNREYDEKYRWYRKKSRNGTVLWTISNDIYGRWVKQTPNIVN